MRPKGLWIAGGIALVAVLLVGGTLLMTPKTPKPKTAAKPSATKSATSRPAIQRGKATLVTDAGSSLKQIVQPPAETLAFLDPKQATAGASYSVTFVPYGYGPGGPDRTLVVKCEKAVPADKAAQSFSLTGRNMLLDISRVAGKVKIGVGGTYSGTVKLEKQANGLIPTLVDVSPQK